MATAKLRIQGEDATGAAFRSALGNAKKTADSMSGAFRSAFAGISVAAIASFGRQAIEAGDNLAKFQVKAKLSAESASSLAYAARLADIDLDALGTSLQKMQIFLSKAASGEKLNVEGLDAIGVKISKLRGLKADEQFELIAEQISRMGSESDQTRAVVDIFTKSGAALLPMFQKGAAGIREAREEAEKLGLLFTEGEIANLSKADEAIKRLDASWDHFAGTLTAKVAPSITYALDRLSGKPKDIYEQVADQEELVQNLKYARGANAAAAREAAAKKLNNLKQRMYGQSSRDLGVMPQDPVTPAPPGYKDTTAIDKADKDLERLSERISDTTDKLNDDLTAQLQDRLDEQNETELKQLEMYTQAQKDAEDELAEYRTKLSNERYELEQQRIDDLAYDLTDALLRGEDGFKDMLRSWFADWLQSDIRGVLGSLFGHGGGEQGGGGILGGLLGSGKGGGSGFMPGEWSHGQGGLGRIFGSTGGLLGFAGGGRPPTNRPSWVGDGGEPELFWPDQAGTIIPAHALGGAMSNHIEVNVTMQGGSSNARQDGQRVGRVVADIVEDRIITKLRRHGYNLN